MKCKKWNEDICHILFQVLSDSQEQLNNALFQVYLSIKNFLGVMYLKISFG
jgi:hypothetical protein